MPNILSENIYINIHVSSENKLKLTFNLEFYYRHVTHQVI